jgi:hypothetical protein
MIAATVNVFGVPAGLVEGWKSGFKKNQKLYNDGDWIAPFGCEYSKLCRAFNGGMSLFIIQSVLPV